MIAIIDSGSTKSDWVILDQRGKKLFSTRTSGLNPYFLTKEAMVEEIRKNEGLLKLEEQITSIYFYGAGCSAPQYTKVVKEALDEVFLHSKNSVEHDLLAAAYACYKGDPVIACILGTGSNSCFFDGKQLREETPSLAYILGDEGSGSYIGKRVLRSFFLKKMPVNISLEFEKFFKDVNSEWKSKLRDIEVFKKHKLDIKEKPKGEQPKDQLFYQMNEYVYSNPFANTYLASFNKFVVKHEHEPFFQRIIYDSLKDFILNQILVYPEARKVKLNFIGSIAYFYEKTLLVLAAEFHLTIGKIIQKPIDDLVNYHRKHILPSLEEEIG